MSPRRGPWRLWRVRPRERVGELFGMAGMLSLLVLFMTRPDWDDLGWQIVWAAASAATTGLGIFLLFSQRGKRDR